MVMPITDEEREELREEFAGEIRTIDRRERAALDRLYPKPDEQDILQLFDDLREEWRGWRWGSELDAGEDETGAQRKVQGLPGVMRIRAMRYHRDEMPQKWFERLNVPYRFRSNLTANELARTVALATRNPPRVVIPASSDDPRDADAADRERRAMQALLPALERQAGKPLLRINADGLFEGGLSVFEVFLRDVYDDLELEQYDDEDDESYMRRTDEEMLRATKRKGLPIGVRVSDPVAVYADFDDHGLCALLVVEHRTHRRVYNSLARKLSFDKLEALQLPKPGEGAAVPEEYRLASPGGNALRCIRYLDRRWYAYMVGGRMAECQEHGFSRVPAVVTFGDVTSSSVVAEGIQGVVAGMVEQEQAINDYITTRLDIAHTFGRPKPVIERSETAPDSNMPATVDLSKPEQAVRLGRGESIKDAYQQFGDRMSDPLLATMMGIRGTSGLNPISAGESPGADPSGFAINSLQAANQMRYEILLDNFGAGIGELIDLIREAIKDGPLGDRIFVPVELGEGEWDYVGLGPDDISDMPCQVTIDPMNDVNRLAIRESLMVANQRGYIPRRVVQEQGFGADNPRAWDNEIAEDEADRNFLGMAFEEAKRRVYGDAAPPGPGGEQPVIYDQHGNPIQSGGGGGAPSAETGAEAVPPRPSSVGPEAARASARARGGQQPVNQGVPGQTPAGAP